MASRILQAWKLVSWQGARHLLVAEYLYLTMGPSHRTNGGNELTKLTGKQCASISGSPFKRPSASLLYLLVSDSPLQCVKRTLTSPQFFNKIASSFLLRKSYSAKSVNFFAIESKFPAAILVADSRCASGCHNRPPNPYSEIPDASVALTR